MNVRLQNDEETSVRRLLPGDTGQDPFAAFDKVRAAAKQAPEPKEVERRVPRYVSDEEIRADLPKSDTPAAALTAERGKTHGDFRDHALFTQVLKDAMRSFVRLDGSHPWEELTPSMKESLDMNAHKIGRILAGKAAFKDHWADIAGYSQLVADECPE